MQPFTYYDVYPVYNTLSIQVSLIKGQIEEIISYARFADDISKYMVLYRDFDQVVESTLQNFLEQIDPPIPWHRIHVIYLKAENHLHSVYVKYGHCPKCGMKYPDKMKRDVCECGQLIEL